ncbi:hypothetical protein [Cohnella caldifontis]|uniref:hypothetical protein n=1 Tax=Cohnella caldifontis TaxID=3027471 RepID=UPI0023ED6980|nr:hypothetical protein [Cohnella sp. YIM B05605]
MRRFAWAGLLSLMLLVLGLTRANAPLPAFAVEPLPEDTKKLLEKSLSVVEIDREVARISELRQEAERKIAASRQQIAALETIAAAQREKTDRVLRAYYMGRKDFILAALLNARSLPDLLRTWESMDLLIQSDRAEMDRYAAQTAQLKEGYAALRQDLADLTAVESELQAQRNRLIDLQDEIGRALASSGDEAHLRQMMDELQSYWKNVGLFEVKRQFRLLADAMQDLPDWIREHPEIMETKGLQTKLTITDAQLNDFLRSRSGEFNQFEIRFERDRMKLSGDNGSMQVEIAGHYSIEEEPENAILFHVDSLKFNGLELPDTTRADLERQFDLGFYPQKLVKFVKAKSVKLEPGTLTVELKVG